MTNRHRLVLVLLVGALILAVPSTVLAHKQRYIAKLSTGHELHQVVGSEAMGNAQLISRPSGIEFRVRATGLSGAPTGVHIHAPADVTQNAPVVISLCGAPGPAAVSDCTYDGNGGMFIEGTIEGSLLQAWGLTAAQLLSWMDAGLAYINVHTALNPAGEVRGQIEYAPATP